MFQLTTPLTPAPGRAGHGIVPGAGGGKGAVALPDFLSLALPGVPDGTPGKARQDPAGDGEAVPGGTVVAAPAGHPADRNAVPDIALPVGAAAEEVPPNSLLLRDVPAAQVAVSSKTSERAPVLRSLASGATAIVTTGPLEGTETPPAASVAVARQKLPVMADMAEAEPAPARLKRFAPAEVQMPKHSIARHDDALAADGPLVAEIADVAPTHPIRPRPTKRATPDEDGALAVSAPSLAAIPPAPKTEAIEPIDPSATPVPIAGATKLFDKTMRATPQPADVRTIRPVAPDAASRTVATDAKAGLIAPAMTDPIATRQDAAAMVEPIAAAPGRVARRQDVAGISLGVVARMLDGTAAPAPAVMRGAPAMSAPVSAGAAVVAPAPPAANLQAANLLTPTSPITPLPPMPASVAAFFASVGPRSVAAVSEIAPRLDRRSSVDDGAVRPPLSIALPSVTTLAVPETPITVRPAGQMFADAIHAATGQGERLRHVPGETDATGLSSVSAVTTPAATAAITERTPIDMTRAHWPLKMIERIEVLRDAADAQDTRIRLIPDALGAIDVAMTRDGDTVRVHLAAERPETRAMIADAQPRLAELGEQRGLKIAASSGQGAGSQTAGQPGSQDFHQPRGNPTPQQPVRPASARAGDPSTSDDDGGQRLA